MNRLAPNPTDFEIVLWLGLIAALWLAFDFTVLSWLAAGKRGERERDAEAGPAQRHPCDGATHCETGIIRGRVYCATHMVWREH